MTMLTADPSSWRVLVIDDKQSNLDLIAAILEPRGAVVIRSVDGREAPRLIAEHDINMILLDLAMPDYSGWETFQDLRSEPKYDPIPIIGVTALVMTTDVSHALSMGF